MKNKITSLLLALIMMLDIVTMFPTDVFAIGTDGNSGLTGDLVQDNTENYIEGMVTLLCDGVNPVSLNKGEKLYAFTTLDPSLGENARYSWEIYTGSGKWASISGYVFHFAVISEALLYNAAIVNGAANLRCIVTIDDDKYVSDILKVILPASDNQVATASYTEEALATEEPMMAAFSARGLADEPDFLGSTSTSIFQIVINYTYRHDSLADEYDFDLENAANTFTVTLPENTYYTGTVATPLEIGYLPYVKVAQAKYVTGAPQDAEGLENYINANKIAYGKDKNGNDEYYVLAHSIQFNNQTESITVDVCFIPQEVTYSVKIFEQNLYDDEYTLAETITMTGIANSRVGEGLAASRVGFTSLYYDPEMGIDEDGSFVLELYYDRIYYLVDFDLNDNDEAYGVTNHYARFKTTVVLPPATRPGHVFLNWTLTSVKNNLEDTEQVTEHNYPTQANGGYIINSVEHNLDYIANWQVGKTSYTIIYWLENADDDNFTLSGFKTVTDVTPGATIKVEDIVSSLTFTDSKYFTFDPVLSDKSVKVASDGTTAVNLYYLRNYYTMTFNGSYACMTEPHTHTAACNTQGCGYNHIHNATCGKFECGLEAHTHTSACGNADLKCGKEEHTHVGECCSLAEHAHTSDCCSIPYHVHGTGSSSDCTKTEHPIHHDTCYSRNKLKEVSALTDSEKTAYTTLQSKIEGPLNGYVYCIRTTRNSTIYNFLYVHDQWFYLGTTDKNGKNPNYNGVTVTGLSTPGTAAGSTSSAKATAICGLDLHEHGDGTCDCPITEHDHTTGCECNITRHVHGEGDCNYSVCGKESHRHTLNCYTHNCGKTAHTHTGNCRRTCQEIAHTHTTNCTKNTSQNFLQIKAKYNADISSIWTDIENSENIPAGIRWKDSKGTFFSEVLVYVPFMLPGDVTFQANEGTANKYYTIQYYLESLDTDNKTVYKNKYFDLNNSITARYGYLTPDEDFFDIRGFTQFEAAADSVTSTQIKDEKDYQVELYYTRNEYKLEFVSLGTTLSTRTKVLKYQQPIDASYELFAKDVPYPSSKDKGAIQFVGWYTTPNCADGTEFVFDGSTIMPEGGLVLYAKWEACSYTAKIYTDKTKTTLFDSQTVLFDSFIDEPNYLHIQHPELGGDRPGEIPDGEQHPDIDDENHKIFTGWYYIVDGQPVRFDFNTMSVKFDMEIYAGWTTRTPVSYSVRYVFWNGTKYVEDIH